MKATEILMSEHRVIERVLAALETAALALEQGAVVRPELFLTAADFIQGFADGCHHRKEEGVLFAALAANGLPQQSGPVAVMLHEHELGRTFTRQMRAAATRLAAGDESARPALVESARSYARLLGQHILKEDRVLFPLADRAIPAGEHAAVLAGFERVEHAETGAGVHEKYRTMADGLVSEVLGPENRPFFAPAQ
ncbi:MAG TPA: hemerythrin domain-containing protein [Anaerolineaceae bacterium]|nr:hemerythrin domain-containing protein [Anaerolineaceae bacterium]